MTTNVKPVLPAPVRAQIVDFEMSFSNMVVFMVKWMIASIVAALFVGLGIMAVFGVLSLIATILGLALGAGN